jgi:hypothetical protein
VESASLAEVTGSAILSRWLGSGRIVS